MSTRPSPILTRRHFIATAGALAGTGLLEAQPVRLATTPATGFRFCLNLSTIRGQNLDLVKELEIAAKAGYDAIEPWLGKLHEFVAKGGSLKDLRRRIGDLGLTVESAIGFATWIVDDETQRAKGMEEAKRDMELLAEIGGKRIAASPAGANAAVALDAAAARYRELLDLGKSIGVIPQIEMWGGHPAVGTVAKAVFIALQSGHPDACFLGDAYHTFKGGCDFSSFSLLAGPALRVFHMNDYPAEPSREALTDAHRVYPGDGIAPLAELLRTFLRNGAAPVLSLELFNKQYWALDPLEVAKTGLAKMRAVAAAAEG
ncbi:MAG: sugar phosphate isomerase/epimerase [Verrucomicrobia bacterium]|nr:sugar phosphate isomerase/epimerase [Verrucomicrobiota bacterium]